MSLTGRNCDCSCHHTQETSAWKIECGLLICARCECYDLLCHFNQNLYETVDRNFKTMIAKETGILFEELDSSAKTAWQTAYKLGLHTSRKCPCNCHTVNHLVVGPKLCRPFGKKSQLFRSIYRCNDGCAYNEDSKIDFAID